MLETRKIGSLEVTVVGLGTNNFGGRLSDDASAPVIHAALDAGVNFIDTADAYGETRSETCIGNALGKRRDDVVLATKFGLRVDDDHPGGGSPTYVRLAAEESLRRLATDHIDLYIFHRPDPATPIAETLGALGELVQSGKIREIGCSGFSVEQLVEAEAAAAGGAARFVNLQSEYSLLHRAPEEGLLEQCERSAVAFVPFYPLAKGFLTGKYRNGTAAPEGSRLATDRRRDQVLNEENFQLLGVLEAFAATRGRTILELAIGWLLARAQVASVIAGATSASQVEANVEAAGWKLTDDEVREVDRLASLA